LEEQKAVMDKALFSERKQMVDILKKKEMDIFWREHQAR
jgi:hypothetical protein